MEAPPNFENVTSADPNVGTVGAPPFEVALQAETSAMQTENFVPAYIQQEDVEDFIDEAKLMAGTQAHWERNKMIRISSLEARRDQFRKRGEQHDTFLTMLLAFLTPLSLSMCIVCFVKFNIPSGFPPLLATILLGLKLIQIIRKDDLKEYDVLRHGGAAALYIFLATLCTAMFAFQSKGPYVYFNDKSPSNIILILTFLWLLVIFIFSAIVVTCSAVANFEMSKILEQRIAETKQLEYEAPELPEYLKKPTSSISSASSLSHK